MTLVHACALFAHTRARILRSLITGMPFLASCVLCTAGVSHKNLVNDLTLSSLVVRTPERCTEGHGSNSGLLLCRLSLFIAIQLANCLQETKISQSR